MKTTPVNRALIATDSSAGLKFRTIANPREVRTTQGWFRNTHLVGRSSILVTPEPFMELTGKGNSAIFFM
jgi:hypothetical protein